MNKKLLLFDVDGTLVSYDGTIPQSCIDALKQAKDKGHYIFVVTGRTRNRATVGDIEVSGMICGNGAYIECEGKVLKDQKLSLQQVIDITDYLDQHDLCYFMEGNDGLYGSHDFETKAVIPLEAMQQMYDKIPSPKVMMRRKEADHGEMLYSADGYVTAWLMWQLQDDIYASQAFLGNNAEIYHNDLYQDVHYDK